MLENHPDRVNISSMSADTRHPRSDLTIMEIPSNGGVNCTPRGPCSADVQLTMQSVKGIHSRLSNRTSSLPIDLSSPANTACYAHKKFRSTRLRIKPDQSLVTAELSSRHPGTVHKTAGKSYKQNGYSVNNYCKDKSTETNTSDVSSVSIPYHHVTGTGSKSNADLSRSPTDDRKHQTIHRQERGIREVKKTSLAPKSSAPYKSHLRMMWQLMACNVSANGIKAQPERTVDDVRDYSISAITEVSNDDKPAVLGVTNVCRRDAPDVGNDGIPAVAEVRNDGRPAVTEVRNDGKPPVTEFRNDGRPDVTDVRNVGKPHVNEVRNVGKPPVNEVRIVGRPPVTDVRNVGRPDVTDVRNVGRPAATDVRNVGRTAVTDVRNVGRTAVTDVRNVGRTAVTDVRNVGRTAVTDVRDEGRAAVTEVTTTGTLATTDQSRKNRHITLKKNNHLPPRLPIISVVSTVTTNRTNSTVDGPATPIDDTGQSMAWNGSVMSTWLSAYNTQDSITDYKQVSKLRPPHTVTSLKPHTVTSRPPRTVTSRPRNTMTPRPPHTVTSLTPHIVTSRPPHAMTSRPPHAMTSLTPHTVTSRLLNTKTSRPPHAMTSLTPHTVTSRPPHIVTSRPLNTVASRPPHTMTSLPKSVTSRLHVPYGRQYSSGNKRLQTHKLQTHKSRYNGVIQQSQYPPTRDTPQFLYNHQHSYPNTSQPRHHSPATDSYQSTRLSLPNQYNTYHHTVTTTGNQCTSTPGYLNQSSSRDNHPSLPDNQSSSPGVSDRDVTSRDSVERCICTQADNASETHPMLKAILELEPPVTTQGSPGHTDNNQAGHDTGTQTGSQEASVEAKEIATLRERFHDYHEQLRGLDVEMMEERKERDSINAKMYGITIRLKRLVKKERRKMANKVKTAKWYSNKEYLKQRLESWGGNTGLNQGNNQSRTPDNGSKPSSVVMDLSWTSGLSPTSGDL